VTQIERSRRLASAFQRLDKAEAAVQAARAAVTEAFNPWAAGRCINRDKAREQLVSTGFLEG
jgi:hypothetical protein